MTQVPDRLRGSVADPIGASWRAQRFILVSYLAWTIYALITWDSPRTALALVATALAWAGQWGLTALLFRVIRPTAGRWIRNRFVIVTALLLIIVVVAIVVGLIFTTASYTNGWTVVWRFTMTLIITALVGRLTMLAHTLQREADAQESLRELRTTAQDSVHQQRQHQVDQIVAVMDEALEGVSSNPQQASEHLQKFAQDYLRPLSHAIHREDSFAPPVTGQRTTRGLWRDVANAVSSRPALKPWLMAVTVSFVYWIAAAVPVEETPVDVSDATGVNLTLDLESFLYSFASFVIIFFVTALSSIALRRWLTRLLPRLGLAVRLILLLLAPIAIAALVELAIQILYVTPGFNENISSNFFDRLLFAIPLVVIAFAVIATRVIDEIFASAERRAAAATQELSWQVSRLQCIYTQEQQFFAAQLHGPLQSLAASASLRVATTSPGTPEWDLGLTALRSDFNDAVQRLAAGPEAARDVAAELDTLRRTWDGVCEVAVRADDGVIASLDADWVSAAIVMDICVEAVANAAIHGKATRADIDMGWTEADHLRVDVTNNGSTVISGSPGLGSEILDRVTISWSRDVIDDQLRLRAFVAVPRYSADPLPTP